MSDFRSHRSSDVVEGESPETSGDVPKTYDLGNATALSIGGRCIPSYRPYKMVWQASRRVLPIKLKPPVQDDPP